MATMTQRTTAVGVFNTRSEAQHAVNGLRQAGFGDANIGVAGRDMSPEDREIEETNAVGASAAAGAAAGAGLGAVWGFAVATSLIPGIGPVIAGGALATIFASAAAGTALGGLAGGLVGLGVPEDEAARYESEFQAGRMIVTVKASKDRYSEAAEILSRHGAVSNQNP